MMKDYYYRPVLPLIINQDSDIVGLVFRAFTWVLHKRVMIKTEWVWHGSMWSLQHYFLDSFIWHLSVRGSHCPLFPGFAIFVLYYYIVLISVLTRHVLFRLKKKKVIKNVLLPKILIFKIFFIQTYIKVLECPLELELICHIEHRNVC